MRLGFDEWLPDFGYLRNPGTTEAKNVLPSPDGYQPLLSLATITDAIDSTCLGAISVIAKDGSIYTYAGSKNSLYELDGVAWKGRLNHYFTSQTSDIGLTGASANVVFS